MTFIRSKLASLINLIESQIFSSMSHSDKKSSKGQPKTSAKSNQGTPPNQKKTSLDSKDNSAEKTNNSNSHYTKFSSNIFKGSQYMPQFIKQAEDIYSFMCSKCKDENSKPKVLLVNSLSIHIKSDEHKLNTPEKEHTKLDELIALLSKTAEANKKRSQKAKQVYEC